MNTPTQEKRSRIVFLCGARDYHAMDWYRSAKKLLPNREISILTDLIAGEGFKKLVGETDDVACLIVLDNYLFKHQTKIGNYWRNFLKLLVFPIQVLLIRRYASKHPNSIYYAHSMYYLWLACAAKVQYVGTPQGSDLLIKPSKSMLYRAASSIALKHARAVTVDSLKMADAAQRISNVKPIIIQNGVDLGSIHLAIERAKKNNISRNLIISMRGITPLYRIREILESRNNSHNYGQRSLCIIYPFYEGEYFESIRPLLRETDVTLGRVSRDAMYELFLSAILVLSIPSSDSSPRSVYEAIFCGAIVAVTYNSYIDTLPVCMRSRIVLVNLNDDNWFSEAIRKADLLKNEPYIPSIEALELFDQEKSFRRLEYLLVS